jgi:hypothetical protein
MKCRIWKQRNVYCLFNGKYDGKKPLQDLTVEVEITLKLKLDTRITGILDFVHRPYCKEH